MAKRRQRRPVVFKRDIRFGKHERIRIPQPPDRPLQLRQKDLVKREFIKEDPHWWTLHRRGPKRERVGEDPLELRAVPKEQVRGTLPERILYLALIRVMHFAVDADFDFQSSLAGGRLELGGIVADFLFPWMRLIIRVQGPTHTEFLRMRKDEEQRAILVSMGFEVWDIEDKVIYDEYMLEDWLRRKFGLRGRGVGGGAYAMGEVEEEPDLDLEYLELIWAGVREAEQKIDDLFVQIPLLM